MVSAIRETQEGSLPIPEVQDPLYACQQYAVINNCLPGSDIEIYVDKISRAVICAGNTSVLVWSSSIVGGYVEGKSITVRQTVCDKRITSRISVAVIVKPSSEIPRPAIRIPLYDGDSNIVIAMTVAGEVITVESDGIQIGMGGASGGDSILNIDPKLVAGSRIVAKVELCGAKKTSFPVIVSNRPSSIPQPIITEHLYSCSEIVQVHQLLPGATVRVYATKGIHTTLLGISKTSEEFHRIGVMPLLQEGWEITANQELGGIRSHDSDQITVQADPHFPRPTLQIPIYECARCIRVNNVIHSARIDIYKNELWIGGADASTTSADVEVFSSLTSGAQITAIQTLCDHSNKSKISYYK